MEGLAPVASGKVGSPIEGRRHRMAESYALGRGFARDRGFVALAINYVVSLGQRLRQALAGDAVAVAVQAVHVSLPQLYAVLVARLSLGL